MTKQPYYSIMDIKGIGLPGQEPFTRGLHANGYRGRMFTIRQLSGAGSPEYVNQRIKWLLDSGATGVNLILDLATIQMFDSDEPEAKGQVGTVGVPIDCADDMDVIFKDIALDEVSVSLVTHYPRNTAILFPMYLLLADRRSIPWDKLKGSVQNDFIMENLVRNASEYIPPKDAFRIQCDNIEFITKNVPLWNGITLNGYNLRELGTSAVTEMAVAMANGIATLSEMTRRGHDVDSIAPRMSFFWSIGNDFFGEVARLRAARRIWHRIVKGLGAKNPRSMWARCHVQTSGITLQRQEPFNNIVRSGYQALAAILGGVQSLHVDSYDEAYSVPSEESALLSLRTQQIIEVETGITEVVDPLGGSYYIETLTNEVEQQIMAEIQEIEEQGGIVKVVEDGWLQRKILKTIREEQKAIEDGEKKIVGRNYYQAPEHKVWFRGSDLQWQSVKVGSKAVPDIKVHEYDDGLRQEMCRKLDRHRRSRDRHEVNDGLEELYHWCQRPAGNLMEECLGAAKAGATEGEMRRVFSEAFGSWNPPVRI